MSDPTRAPTEHRSRDVGGLDIDAPAEQQIVYSASVTIVISYY